MRSRNRNPKHVRHACLEGVGTTYDTATVQYFEEHTTFCRRRGTKLNALATGRSSARTHYMPTERAYRSTFLQKQNLLLLCTVWLNNTGTVHRAVPYWAYL
jgi:hypothetical protein